MRLHRKGLGRGPLSIPVRNLPDTVFAKPRRLAREECSGRRAAVSVWVDGSAEGREEGLRIARPGSSPRLASRRGLSAPRILKACGRAIFQNDSEWAWGLLNL